MTDPEHAPRETILPFAKRIELPRPEPGNEAVAPAPTFARGDHVELAEAVLFDAAEGSPVGVVHDQGDFHAYDPATGTHRVLPREELVRRVSAYAGAEVSADSPRGRRGTLKLKHFDVEGVLKLAAQTAARPGYFDGAVRGVAFRNGFVTLEGHGAALRPHDPKHRARHALAFDYDPAAPAALWTRTLEQIFTHPAEAGETDPARLAAYALDRAMRITALEEFLGATLLGRVVRHEVCLVLVGDEGANGKSTLLHVLRALFPADAVRSIKPQRWDDQFHVARLAGARVNLVNEMPDGDVASGDTFKAVISGDPIAAAHKYRDPFTLRCEAAHVFACNRLPGTTDQTGGYWRRWLVLLFERTFAEHERNRDLRHQLTRPEELRGIAARLVAAAERLEQRGRFELPTSSRVALEEWQLDADQVRQFVEACCVPCAATCDPKRCPNHRSKIDDLYPLYALWAKANGHAALASNKLGGRLKMLKLDRRTENERWFTLAIKSDARARHAR